MDSTSTMTVARPSSVAVCWVSNAASTFLTERNQMLPDATNVVSGNLEIQHTDFLMQALRENQNANKYKLKIQKCFLLFSNQCNCSSFMHFGIDCFVLHFYPSGYF